MGKNFSFPQFNQEIKRGFNQEIKQNSQKKNYKKEKENERE